MKTRIFSQVLIIAVLVLSACSQAGMALPESRNIPNAEIKPPADLTDPESDQPITGKCGRNSDEVRLLINAVQGYCLQYPAEYDVIHPNESEIMLFRRSVLNIREPSVGIKVHPTGEATLEQAADQIAQVYAIHGVEPIREPLTIDGEAAILLAGLSGQDPNRQVVVRHKDQLYHLFFIEFNKSDPEYARFETLYSTVIQSFNFNPESNACPDCPLDSDTDADQTQDLEIMDPDQRLCTDPITLTPGENQRIVYKGISFVLNPALGKSVLALECPTVPFSIDSESGTAHPAYIGFKFLTDRKRIDYQPELRVYSVEGDTQSFLYPINSLDDLNNVASKQLEPITWFDGAPLHVQRSYLSFGNGKGVRGVVEYAQDIFFFTNNGLLYEYDGLADGGRLYVNLRYPVSVSFLIDIENSDPGTNINPLAIAIPEWGSDYEQQRQIIDAYNQEAVHRFNDAESITPGLPLLDALVGSLTIEIP